MELLKPSSNIMPYDENPLKHIELVARNCYKSEDKITDESAPKFVKNLYERGHHAMLEFYPFYFLIHNSILNKLVYLNQLPEIDGDFKYLDRDNIYSEASCNLRTVLMIGKYDDNLGTAIINRYPELQPIFNISFGTGNEDVVHLVDTVYYSLQYLTGRFICDRGVTHELVRHRKCSFAQESTRYCNYGKQEHVKFIIPSWLDNLKEGIPNVKDHISSMGKDLAKQATSDWLVAMAAAEEDYNDLIKEYGWSPQQARSVLPNSLKTEIIVQARLSEWKHIFEQRCSPKAHPDMQALMIPFREQVRIYNSEYFDN